MVTEGSMLTNPSALLDAVERTVRTKRGKSLYRAYILRLEASGVPVILSPGHLADVIGIDYGVLRSMAFGASSFYESFSIPKASGGYRQIDAPLPSLAAVQRFIQEQILSQLDVNPSASAYTKGKSILDHVKPHAKSTSLLRVDIRNFFPSITTLRIRRMLGDLGYSQRLSNFLAHLLTLNGSLPQGAPSSPLISNLALKSFDEKMNEFSENNNCRYTRYADDIAISGDQSTVRPALTYIESLLADEGFSLNNKKTRQFGKSHAAWFLTGLSISRDGRVRLPKSKRKAIKQQVFYLVKYMRSDLATPNQYSKRLLEDVLLPDRVIGKLRFWLWVDPDDGLAQSLLSQLRDSLQGITQGSWEPALVSELIDTPDGSPFAPDIDS